MSKQKKIEKLNLLKSKNVLYADYTAEQPLVRPGEQELEKKINELIEAVNKLRHSLFMVSTGENTETDPNKCGCIKSCYTSTVKRKTYCYCVHGRTELREK